MILPLPQTLNTLRSGMLSFQVCVLFLSPSRSLKVKLPPPLSPQPSLPPYTHALRHSLTQSQASPSPLLPALFSAGCHDLLTLLMSRASKTRVTLGKEPERALGHPASFLSLYSASPQLPQRCGWIRKGKCSECTARKIV